MFLSGVGSSVLAVIVVVFYCVFCFLKEENSDVLVFEVLDT